MTSIAHIKFPILILAILLLVWPGGALFSTPQGSEDTSKTDLLARLADFRSLCDNGQFIQALKVGYDAVHEESLFKNSLYFAQESLLFEAAVAHLDYTDKIVNPTQAKQCAAKSAALWKKYIEWYHQLSAEQRSNLPDSHVRIKMAVAHLGNALIRKGDIYSLFDEYSSIAARKKTQGSHLNIEHDLLFYSNLNPFGIAFRKYT
jgi:hypothetical protein